MDTASFHPSFRPPKKQCKPPFLTPPNWDEGTNASLASASATTIHHTSKMCNQVATLNMAFSDPPTHADLEQVRDKINELINALRR